MSCWVFPYLADPFGTIIGINHILKPDGIAFVSKVPITPVIPECEKPEHRSAFIDTLQTHGFEVTINEKDHFWQGGASADFSWRKIDNLVLPLTYSGETKDIHLGSSYRENYFYSTTVLTYALALP